MLNPTVCWWLEIVVDLMGKGLLSPSLIILIYPSIGCYISIEATVIESMKFRSFLFVFCIECGDLFKIDCSGIQNTGEA